MATPIEVLKPGSFTSNMSLPIHRWFRYSAGFSAQWVKDLISKKANENDIRGL